MGGTSKKKSKSSSTNSRRKGSSSSSSRRSTTATTTSKKRRIPQQQESSDEDVAMWTSNKSKKKNKNSITGINESAAEGLFAEIADEEDPTVASMEGIFKLGERLGMDATEDIRILVLMYKLGATDKPAQITKNEWMQGCASQQVDSWPSLQDKLPSLDTGFMERTEFKDFYKFCFQFNREGTHKTLDKDLVVALLKLVLKDRVDTVRLDTFCDFLSQATGYTRITADQWTSFLDFCYECEDLSQYDEASSAWPVLIDEYVEYMEQTPPPKKS